jgi:hypothetical protein
MRKFFCLLWALLLCMGSAYAQKSSTYVDKKGVLRWTKGNKEVTEFGVHYALPFSTAYENFTTLGLSHEKGVDEDVYHLTRLGLKAYRVHIWDAEITDTLGNLVENHHLYLLDYTIKKMKDRGFKLLITPLNYYETNEIPYGLGQKFGKRGSYTPEGITATKKYLHQFMNHVNRFTGVAYKDEPDIVGFELYNEPEHQGFTNETVVPYINGLVEAVRNSGCTKPLFYCVSIAPNLIKGFLNADIQGTTMQWYSVSHNAAFEFKGNLLTHVDQWPKDSLTDASKERHKALLSYEIDAADNCYAYPYPMMARSMREAGFQFASMFSYDPLGIAAYNTEYRTHFMNLAYTPQRALGLKIAGEVFRKVPRETHFDYYPADTLFDVFHVNHPQNLAEMVDVKKFMYTNTTGSLPPAPDKLEEIAGYGSSSVVKYEGRGAYFLDKLEPGVWRLEIMPDATILGNPFGRPQLGKEASAIVWEHYPMVISLPDLGNEFTMTGINIGNTVECNAHDGQITVYPGTYLLVRKGKASKWKPEDKWKDITLNEFVAPKATKNTYLKYEPVEEITSGGSYTIYAEVISGEMPERVELYLSTYAPRQLPPISFERTSRYGYKAVIPQELIDKENMLCYRIAVTQDRKKIIYPQSENRQYADFLTTPMYEMRIVEKAAPIALFDAENDKNSIRRSHRHYRYIFHPSLIPGKSGIELGVNNLIYASHYLRDKIIGRCNDLEEKKHLHLRAKSLSGQEVKMWVILQLENGLEYGTQISLSDKRWNWSIPIDSLKRVCVTGPGEKGFVSVAPLDGKCKQSFSIKDIETVKCVVLPADNGRDKTKRIVLEYITLE